MSTPSASSSRNANAAKLEYGPACQLQRCANESSPPLRRFSNKRPDRSKRIVRGVTFVMNIIHPFSGMPRAPGLSKLASLLDTSLLGRIGRSTRMESIVRLKLFLASWLFLVLLVPSTAFAQGETTSAIVGQVTDASGAAVPGATVTVTSPTTGLQRSLKTDEGGRFNFPQLRPGTYSVKVEADGFDQQQNDNVSSGLGQKQEVDFTLRVAHSEQSVQVTTEAPLINTANANTSSTLSGPVLANIPNPGGDLTYPLQFASGALINTAGSSSDAVGGANGYGNVEFNGLPATSNGYIV